MDGPVKRLSPNAYVKQTCKAEILDSELSGKMYNQINNREVLSGHMRIPGAFAKMEATHISDIAWDEGSFKDKSPYPELYCLLFAAVRSRTHLRLVHELVLEQDQNAELGTVYMRVGLKYKDFSHTSQDFEPRTQTVIII